MSTKNSRLSGFYKKSIDERLSIIADWANLTEEEQNTLLRAKGFDAHSADNMVENAIGIFAMPVGVATNFQINGRDYLIPMVIEEPSVVAAVSNSAKVVRDGGGFTTNSDAPIMIGQIQLLDIDDVTNAAQAILDNKEILIAKANEVGGSILKRGGGAIGISVRSFPDTQIGNMLVIHLHYDTRDAMGANAINTAIEHIAPDIEQITDGRVNLRILSNLSDLRKAYASCNIPAASLATANFSGEEAVDAIVEAGIFAELDPYRATTHNKGIMNGIDAVLIATGNDWRAVEAGAHAYAARRGSYSSLTRWWKNDQGDLRGEIELPLAVGIVGGATRVHPAAQIALRILGVESARELAEIAAAVGLAQNLGAIRALATEGIQHGHMRMHARQLAIAAGADAHQVKIIADQMAREDNIRLERAKELVKQLSEGENQ